MLSWILACASPPAPSGPRVVSLHDTTTEIVVGLGRTSDLIAVTAPRFLSPAAEAAVAAVPRLPDGAVSAETLLALQPSLVLGTDVVAERQPTLPQQLTGVPLRLIDPVNLAALDDEVRAIAEDLGADPRPLLDRLHAALPAPVGGEPLPVLLYDCCDPPFVAGGRGPINEVLAAVGGRNVFATLDQDWATVSWEALLASQPALIVVHDYDWGEQADLAGKREALAAHGLTAPTVALPLALALEGPRVVEAAAVLGPALAERR